MCPSGHSDKAWTWVAPAAMEAHKYYAAIHNPMAQGFIGMSPSKMTHGAKPRVKSMIMAEEQEDSAQHADPGNREFVEAIAQAHHGSGLRRGPGNAGKICHFLLSAIALLAQVHKV